jgi:hypothetical protein
MWPEIVWTKYGQGLLEPNIVKAKNSEFTKGFLTIYLDFLVSHSSITASPMSTTFGSKKSEKIAHLAKIIKYCVTKEYLSK